METLDKILKNLVEDTKEEIGKKHNYKWVEYGYRFVAQENGTVSVDPIHYKDVYK